MRNEINKHIEGNSNEIDDDYTFSTLKEALDETNMVGCYLKYNKETEKWEACFYPHKFIGKVIN